MNQNNEQAIRFLQLALAEAIPDFYSFSTLGKIIGGGVRRRCYKLILSVERSDKAVAAAIANSFSDKLIGVGQQLLADAGFIASADPAASGIREVITTYPGFYAIAVYRIARLLHSLGGTLLPRTITELAHSQTGIDIHPGATIGSPFFIDHGTGIVIGETTIIGNRVKLYQGVTLGALSVSKTMRNTKRHPTVEDGVVIYAGSTILGGTTTIGHHSTIGGNVWLTKSVPPYSLVVNESRITIKQDQFNPKEQSYEV